MKFQNAYTQTRSDKNQKKSFWYKFKMFEIWAKYQQELEIQQITNNLFFLVLQYFNMVIHREECELLAAREVYILVPNWSRNRNCFCLGVARPYETWDDFLTTKSLDACGHEEIVALNFFLFAKERGSPKADHKRHFHSF